MSEVPSASQAERAAAPEPGDAPVCFSRIALLGNPNTGKTTLYNRLTALRHKTSNFSGTTQEYRVAPVAGRHAKGWKGELIDLPGIYGLAVNQPESELCREVLGGAVAEFPAPDALCVVLDASSLSRGLKLVAEAARSGLPMIVAVNLIDSARKRGVAVDTQKLSAELGCPVVACSARTGEGVDDLSHALEKPAPIRAASGSERSDPADELKTAPSRSRLVDPEYVRTWADEIAHRVTAVDHHPNRDAMTERIDHLVMHPVLGLVVFAAIMYGLFWSVFKFASIPMDLIDGAFGWMGSFVRTAMGDGAIASLLGDGIIGGVGAAVIFLPQILLLFFLISLLEGTGYLARAALLMDRLFRPFGLPGQSFVPMLSAHACAIPAIMACRGVPGRAERLATILVAPFFSCSARIPVYVLLTGLIFADLPAKAAGAFALCYGIGAIAALGTAAIFRRTILRGPRRLMAIDLPAYRRPSLRTALVTTFDAGWAFVKNAGTVILAMMVVLWWLGAYPNTAPPPEATALSVQAASIEQVDPIGAAALMEHVDELSARHASKHSFMGRIGRTVQPVFEPLGYDWQLTVGVMGSFAAREVFVSTVAVVVAGSDDAEDTGVLDRIRRAKRDDGSPMLTPATSWSLLVFFVLAMQCLPTLAVTAREAGGWKWALLQLGWMSVLAYVSALVVYQGMRAAGVG